MKTVKVLCLVLLVPFTGVTLYALKEVGYVGIFAYHLPSPAGWQVFFDLVVACILLSVWMIRDASRNGRNVWPYLVATLFLGSFGPLAYMLLASSNPVPQRGSVDAPAARS